MWQTRQQPCRCYGGLDTTAPAPKLDAGLQVFARRWPQGMPLHARLDLPKGMSCLNDEHTVSVPSVQMDLQFPKLCS